MYLLQVTILFSEQQLSVISTLTTCTLTLGPRLLRGSFLTPDLEQLLRDRYRLYVEESYFEAWIYEFIQDNVCLEKNVSCEIVLPVSNRALEF